MTTTDPVNHDQAIFDAIAAATYAPASGQVVVDTKKFIEAFNNHRDRALCTSLNVVQAVPEEYPFVQVATGHAQIQSFGAAGEDRQMDFRYHGSESENMIRLSASELACYRWPEDTAEHRALRLAFMEGAATWINQIDRYGAALMMIRNGSADPADLARRVLSEFGIVQTPTPLP